MNANSTEKEIEQQAIDKKLEAALPSEEGNPKSHGEILKQQIIDGQETYDKTCQYPFKLLNRWTGNRF